MSVKKPLVLSSGVIQELPSTDSLAPSSITGVAAVLADANPKARANGYYSTVASASGISIADNANLDMGTNNFTIHWEGLLPDYTPAVPAVLYDKLTGGVGVEIAITNATPAGRVQVYINGVSYYTSAVPSLVDEEAIKLTIVVTRLTTAVVYINGRLFESVSISSDLGGTVNNAASAYTLGYSGTNRNIGTVKSVVLFNRALSALEVSSLCANGIAPADQWGSQTSLSSGTIASSTYAAFDGASGTGFHAVSSGGIAIASTPDAIVFAIGKKYRVSFTCSAITGQAPSYGVSRDTVGSSLGGAVITNTVTAGLNNYEFTSTVADTGTVIWHNSASTEYTISGFSIVEIGATLALTPETIQSYPGQWLDTSSNGLNATLPSTGVTPIMPVSPLNPLSLGRLGGQTLIGGTAATDALKLQGTSGTGTAASPAVQILTGTNGGTVACTVLNNGNTGIGTTSPGSLLQIGNTTANINAFLTLGKTAAATENDLPIIYCGSALVPGSGNDLILAAQSSSGGIILGTSSGSKVSVLNNGNVGIGTTAPGGLLELAKDNPTLAIRSITESVDKFSLLGFYTGTGTLSSSNFIAGLQGIITQANPSALKGDLQFYVNTGDAATEKMRLTSEGNVGIGTASPSAKLDVHGVGTGTGVSLQTADSGGTAKFTVLDNGDSTHVGSVTFGNDLLLTKTITTPGTTGNQTINKLTGQVNIAASGTAVTVTNSLVGVNSIVDAWVVSADATARVTSVVRAAGSFVINTVACTGETAFCFRVTN